MKRTFKRLGLSLAAILAVSGACNYAAAQSAEIVIGAPNPLTGGGGESGRHVINGLQMAIDEINESGGIKSLSGAKLRLVPVDTSSDNPQQAASVTRRLISQDKASILVGSHISTATLSSQIEAERGQVPIITTSFSDQIVQRGYKYTFKIPPQLSVFADKTVSYISDVFADIHHAPLKRVAVFTGSDAASVFIGDFWRDVAKKNGLEVVATGSFPSGMTDPTSVLAPIVQAQPDALFTTGFPDDIILIVRGLRALGLDIPVIGSGSPITAMTIPEALGDKADGIMGTVAWNADLPFDGVKEFRDKYLALHKDEKFVTQEAGQVYAIGKLIGVALEKAASSDPKKIRDVLAKIDVPTFLPGGHITFDEHGLNRNMMPILVQWHGGVLKTIWPKEYQTEAPIVK
jgi:branched-chain amino acid transport system substrate-binding protein